uniref:Macro domain-containing protein n=1 Tax=Strigamia maritima TaxID=126957 RepID=T1JI15_STRMM
MACYKGNNREKYLQMPIEEKRHLYACGGKFILVKDVSPWTVYYERLKANGKVETNFPPPVKDCCATIKWVAREKYRSKISLWRGDITYLEVDAVVNAANTSLMGGGGVDGAIHAGAGAELQAECASLNGCEPGDAKMTGGYKLPARYIIHTVGPTNRKPELLHACYENCLRIAKANGLRTIAFPCIATGVYGYPNEEACKIALETVRKWFDRGFTDYVDRIIFCVFLETDMKIYEKNIPFFFPKIPPSPPPSPPPTAAPAEAT